MKAWATNWGSTCGKDSTQATKQILIHFKPSSAYSANQTKPDKQTKKPT